MNVTLLDRLLEIQSLLHRDMQTTFEGTSLSESCLHVLWVLTHRGACRQADLASALGITARSVSALVDGLEKTGYVSRQPHPEDRRSVQVTLTAEATAMMRRMQKDHDAVNTALVKGLNNVERDALTSSLERVSDNLQQLIAQSRVRHDVEGTS